MSASETPRIASPQPAPMPVADIDPNREAQPTAAEIDAVGPAKKVSVARARLEAFFDESSFEEIGGGMAESNQAIYI